MTSIPSRNSLLPVPPLLVKVFDREWTFTPWFEPVWGKDGRLAALDMQSRAADRETGAPALSAYFFSHLPPEEQFRILRWQLGILAQMTPWCTSRDVCVSLSMTHPVAVRVLEDPTVHEDIQGLASYIRLNLSELFLPAVKSVPGVPFLQGLLSLAPLWLDDFGVGSSGLYWLMSGLFDAVKVDRHLLSTLHVHPGGGQFLDALRAMGERGHTQIIATGVSDPELLAFTREGRVNACQGGLWPGVPAEQVYMLADRCPGDESRVFSSGDESHA